MPWLQDKPFPKKILLDFHTIFPRDILAFVTNRNIDFSLFPELTAEQKQFLSSACGKDINRLPGIEQIHGRRLVVFKQNGFWRTQRQIRADAALTKEIQIPLTVRTADCLSIFVYDKRQKAIGLIHAGWRGTQKLIAARAIEKMTKSFGSKPYDLLVAFGPSIRDCCYQVGESFLRFFPREVKKRGEEFYFDLCLANKRQLVQAGILSRNIFDSRICTCCSKACFSYRREGKRTGRMLSLMMVKD